MPGKRTDGTHLGWDLLSERIQLIDGILNSKREDLVKRLREGNQAWEQRKKLHGPETSDVDHPQQFAKIEWDDDLAEIKRRPRRILRDDEFSSGADITLLQRSSEESERERKVKA